MHPSGPGLHHARFASAGSSRLRVVPWQRDPYVALCGPKPAGRAPSVEDVKRCLITLTELGVHRAVTPALNSQDMTPFLEAGFELHERLHLLAYPLLSEPETSLAHADGYKLRFARPWDRDSVVAIDRLAFEPFWQFDRQALSEARRATPSHRFRVAIKDRSVVGYAVTGRAGHRGYLQRLAVAPSEGGIGIGTALVADCLDWLYRRGAKTAMVNTQERNERAFALYKHLGFRPQAEGLVVLQWLAET